MSRVGEELGRTQGGEKPLAGERIVEARRVARQEHAAHSRLAHAIGERPHGHEPSRRLHAREPRRQVAELLESRAEEGLEPLAPGRGVAERHHEAQIDQSRRHRVQDRVVGGVDVDLAALPRSLDAAHILDERHAAKRVRPHEPEALRHHRRSAVRSHHEARAKLELPTVLILRPHSRDAPVLGQEPGHAVALPHVRGKALRALDEDAVELFTRDRERVVAIASPGSRRRVDAVEHGAVGGDDSHTAERLRARLVHRLEHAEPVEDPRGLGREIFAADLWAREAGLVEERHRPAALGQQDGRRRARGPRPHHDDVYDLHGFTLTAH